MKIYHVSPSKIENIEKNFAIFGDCLFFSPEPSFHMGGTFIYSLKCKESDFVDVSHLDNKDSIDEIISELWDNDIEVSEAKAIDFLNNKDNIYNYAEANIIDCDNCGDIDWFIQRVQGECAKTQGFLGCASVDDNGEVYIIPMYKKEYMLKLDRELMNI